MTTTLWIVVILLVMACAAGLIWYLMKGRAPGAAAASPDGGAAADTQFLAKEAGQRLSASSRAPLARLPVVLVVGDGASTKTTVIVNSGLDPELLAGQDRQQGTGPVPPTPCANFWLAAGTVFVEAGGPLLASAGGVAALASTLRPASTANLLGSGAQAPRALVVCVDIGDFLQPDASATTLAAAKRIRTTVGEVAQAWSSRMPLYVLFTKMDRVNYFADYVRNLSLEEAGRVLGFTLPLAGSLQPGVYNQEQAARLNHAFDELQNVLLTSRQELLRREDELTRTPNTFEFPREFRKLRDDMARFLLELGRPSQLQATPFLRGFFFTGARPVTMPGASAARRVPQWVFLNGFFRDALLGDRLAFQAASTNTGAGTARNWLLGAAAAISLIWFTGATVSFFNNRSLLSAAQARVGRQRPVTLEGLRVVESLRQPASAVSDHMKYGPPMAYRWGVYPGEPMQQEIRQSYCRALEQSMLTETRRSMAEQLASLPVSPGPNDDYDTAYNSLKAYLMLTSNPEKSDPTFLADHLTGRWSATQRGAASEEAAKLVRTQFHFLGTQRASGFCGAPADRGAVEGGRTHLSHFQLVDRAYRSIVSQVNKNRPPIQFTDPTLAMSDPRVVEYAFSKAGFAEMQSAMKKAREYLSREDWVLGKSKDEATPDSLLSDLAKRYQTDFIAKWNAFVDGAVVNSYANLKDAAVKLGSQTSSTSPMVHLFCLVSVNTQVENVAISDAFRPYRGFAAPGDCSTSANGPGNQAYLGGLINLQVAVERVANTPNADSGHLTESDAAKTAALTTATQLNLDAKPAKLLIQPILFVENLLKGVPVKAAQGKGDGFCTELRPLLAKYPFNPASSVDAQPADLAAVFAPVTGRLFTYPQDALQEFVGLGVGGRFVQKTDARVTVNPGFVAFLNKGATLTKLFYSSGTQIRVPFSLQVAPSPDIESVVLQIGGKTLRADSRGGRQDFVWPDDASAVRLEARARDITPQPLETSGTWAVTRFLAAADETSSTGVQGAALFNLRNTSASSMGKAVATKTKSEVPLRISIDMKGAPATLLLRDLQLGCVAAVAR